MNLNAMALVGGVLVGGAAALLWLANRRIAGVSGVLGGLMPPAKGDVAWRVAMIAGLLVGGFAAARLLPLQFADRLPGGFGVIIIAGLLVGFGTGRASGCTSGHGVCGMARMSKRSMVATAVFLATAMLTVFLQRHVLGGGV